MNNSSTAGVYDAIDDLRDGKLTTWNEPHGQIQLKDLQEKYPHADIKVLEVFNNMVYSARRYHEMTGRYLPIWKELGELYVDIEYDLNPHKPDNPKTDDHIQQEAIQVTTISPGNCHHDSLVKTSRDCNRRENFTIFLVTHISPEYKFLSWVHSKTPIEWKRNPVWGKYFTCDRYKVSVMNTLYDTSYESE